MIKFVRAHKSHDYVNLDYHRTFQLTEKSDMYSYSVVLMELTRGMKAIDQCREKREMALADMFVSKFHMRLFIRLLIRCLREKTTVVLRCFGVLQWIRIIVLMQRRSLEILRGLKTVHVWVKMMWRKTNCWIKLQ